MNILGSESAPKAARKKIKNVSPFSTLGGFSSKPSSNGTLCIHHNHPLGEFHGMKIFIMLFLLSAGAGCYYLLFQEPLAVPPAPDLPRVSVPEDVQPTAQFSPEESFAKQLRKSGWREAPALTFARYLGTELCQSDEAPVWAERLRGLAASAEVAKVLSSHPHAAGLLAICPQPELLAKGILSVPTLPGQDAVINACLINPTPAGLDDWAAALVAQGPLAARLLTECDAGELQSILAFSRGGSAAEGSAIYDAWLRDFLDTKINRQELASRFAMVLATGDELRNIMCNDKEFCRRFPVLWPDLRNEIETYLVNSAQGRDWRIPRCVWHFMRSRPDAINLIHLTNPFIAEWFVGSNSVSSSLHELLAGGIGANHAGLVSVFLLHRNDPNLAGAFGGGTNLAVVCMACNLLGKLPKPEAAACLANWAKYPANLHRDLQPDNPLLDIAPGGGILKCVVKAADGRILSDEDVISGLLSVVDVYGIKKSIAKVGLRETLSKLPQQAVQSAVIDTVVDGVVSKLDAPNSINIASMPEPALGDIRNSSKVTTINRRGDAVQMLPGTRRHVVCKLGNDHPLNAFIEATSQEALKNNGDSSQARRSLLYYTLLILGEP